MKSSDEIKFLVDQAEEHTEVFSKLRSNSFEDVFLSKELASVAQSIFRVRYKWIHRFYLLFYIAAVVWLQCSHFISNEAVFNDTYNTALNTFAFLSFCGLWYWKYWNLWFYRCLIAVCTITSVHQFFLFKMGNGSLYLFIGSIIVLFEFAAFLISVRIFGKSFCLGPENDPVSGMYKF